MKAALDTNIMAYAEGVGEKTRCQAARNLTQLLPATNVVIPDQTLGELYRVLTGKAGRSREDAREAILSWSTAFSVVDSTWESFQAAFDLTVDHSLQIWDALILSVAAANHCHLLISEDFQSGFTWRGVTVLDPFLEPSGNLLTDLLEES